MTQFELFSGNRIATIAADSTHIYNKQDGRLRKKYKADTSLIGINYIKSDNGNYGEANSFIKLSIKSDSIIVDNDFKPGKISELSLRPFQDLYAGFVTRDYVLWFAFGNKKKMIVTNRQIDKVIKTVLFEKFDLSTYNEDQVTLDQYYDNFSIDVDADNFYITQFDNHTLSIYKGCLGLIK